MGWAYATDTFALLGNHGALPPGSSAVRIAVCGEGHWTRSITELSGLSVG
eukprot:m.186327 g.186327  ORF g.186327 m.186327 type:complete len:50 (-) comp15048_c1_seq14:4165-4314(-)